MDPFADLHKLISPTSIEDFKEHYFEKQPLLISRNDPAYFRKLLSLGMISAYLERKDIRYPAVRMVKEGMELPQTDYLASFPYGSAIFDNVIDNDRLFVKFSEGATVVFQALHRTIPSLSSLCQNLERYFHFPLQTNIYLTPTSSQGFASHFDNHDVFILQTHGSKIWRVYDCPIAFPTKAFGKHMWQKKEPTLEIELKEGDTLYIPRGFVHDASTTGSASMHITLGLLAFTWLDALKLITDEAHQIQDFRQNLDWSNTSPEQIKQKVSVLFAELLKKIPDDKIGKELSEKVSRKRLSSDHKRLDDLIGMYSLNERTKVQVRKEIDYQLRTNSQEVIFSFYNKRIRFPLYVREPIEEIIALDSFTIKDLTSALDANGKKVLVKKLIKEGFLTLYGHGE